MKIFHWALSVSLIGCCCFAVNGNDFKGFDDNILYSLNWPGTEKLLVCDFFFIFSKIFHSFRQNLDV